jgi:hypothetical protein
VSACSVNQKYQYQHLPFHAGQEPASSIPFLDQHLRIPQKFVLVGDIAHKFEVQRYSLD